MIRRLHTPRRGYAMILMLTVTMVLSVMGVTLLSAARTDLEGSRVLQGRSESRALGVSSVEYLYAQLTSNAALMAAVLDEDPATIPSLPGFNTASAYGTPTTSWASWNGSTLAPCPSALSDCVSFTATVQRDSNNQIRGILLDVTARTRCTGSENRCLSTRFQQRLRKTEIFDYLFFQQFSTLDPNLYPASEIPNATASCADRYAARTNTSNSLGPRSTGCVSVAYNGEGTSRKDIVDGPLYTADDWIVVCGSPEFRSKVEVSGAGYPPSSATPRAWASAPELNPADSCPATPSNLIPSAQQILQAPLLQLPDPTSAGEAAQVADPAYVFTPADPTAGVTIGLQTTGTGLGARTLISVQGSTSDPAEALPLPPSPSVLVVRGNANVSGTLAGALSIFASGDLRITGSVTYAGGGTRSNTRDVLGLTAGGSVVLTQDATAADRTLDAIVLATSGSVYVDGWNQSREGTAGWTEAPTLTFFGALASKYQGVFAGYRQDTGAVVSGYRKAFAFDNRMSSGLVVPPYLLSLTTQGWVRLPIVEVPTGR